MAPLAGDALDVHVVWLPMLAGDDEDGARTIAASFAGTRVQRWWDPGRALGRALGQDLGLRPPAIAWDVYLVYPAGARLGDPPLDWTHQLRGAPRERHVGDDLGAALARLVGRVR